jgi:transglutaminase-like putative cysteine protease
MLWRNGCDMGTFCVWKRVAVVILSATAIAMMLKYCLNYEKEQRHFELSEELEISFANADDIIETIHDGLGKHARSFTITYSADDDYREDTKKLVDELMNCATYNTDSPTEGDYIRYQYGCYKLSYQKTDGRKNCDYRLTITPIYYSTMQEEYEVDEKVEKILEELNIDKTTSEREKVKAVYDYICHNVNYDYVHENNSLYHKDSTAYAALVKKYASCQGYAVAVFRLLKELGIECNVVTGTGINNQGESEFHAWNEVSIDDEMYNMDATWDAGRADYQYFLIKDEEFVNHVRD